MIYKAQSTCRSTRSTPIETPPKHGFLNASTASSGDENRCPRIFSWYAGIKRSHWMPSQGCTADDPSIRCFWTVKKARDMWQHALSWWTMIRLCCSFFEFRRRLSANKLWWPSCDTQEQQSLHDQFCRRNRRPSASKCFLHEQLSLDLARLRRPTRWSVVLFRAHTPRCSLRHLWWSNKRLLKHRDRIFETFLYTYWDEPFLSDSGIQRDQIFFTTTFVGFGSFS